jgi:hypothetical protein
MKNSPIEPFEIVDDYFCSVCDMPEEELDSDSLALVQVWHSSGLIENGGLHSYLCAIGDEAATVANGYRHVGIVRGCDLILSALALWKTYWPDTDPEKSDPDEFRSRFESELDVIEEEFYGLEDEIVTQLARTVSLLGKRQD